MTQTNGQHFPADFVWGAATVGVPDRGRRAEDGRGPSIWDTFCAHPGQIADGDTGDVACDHYHRYAEDIALMQELGIDAYRFSIAWPRVAARRARAGQRGGPRLLRPPRRRAARGRASRRVTLYHWDLPQALEDAGGWPHARRRRPSPTTPRSSRDARRPGQALDHASTSRRASSLLGYGPASTPRGARRLPAGARGRPPPAARPRPRGPGAAARRAGSQVGIVLTRGRVYPATDDPRDAEAAHDAATASGTAVPRPGPAGRLPGGRPRARSAMPPDGPRRRPEPRSPRRSTSSACNYYSRRLYAADPAASRRSRSRDRRPDDARWAGRSTPRGSTSCSSG